MKKIIAGLTAVSLLSPQLSFAQNLVAQEKQLSKVSSTSALGLNRAKVIIDNDDAFQSKLDAIRSATKSIDMVYYIYSNDYSSAVITRELMKKARSGVKVRLLLDYLTNLKNSELLLTMQSAGVEIKLYNKPTENIRKDAVFVTTACANKTTGPACAIEKNKKSAELLAKGNGTDFMSRLFITGLYAKQGTLLKASVLEGQEIDVQALMNNQGSASKEEQEQLKEFGKLFFEAKVKGSLIAKFKLWLAFQIYGEQLAPIYNLITETLPLTSEGVKAKDWMYLSDYTHHKLLLVDDRFAQLGGRNIEDSYHMKVNDLHEGEDKKYIFMDTDFAADLTDGSGKELRTTFDRLWNLDWMVSSMQEVESMNELDAMARQDLLAEAVGNCQNQESKKSQSKAACIAVNFNNLKNQKDNRTARLQVVEKSIIDKAEVYERKHNVNAIAADNIGINGGELSARDLKNAKIFYVENLPFARPNWAQKLIGDTDTKRQYGADLHNEYKSNKNIHEVLVRGLENVCKKKTGSKEVVLHNAYFFPSPNIMRTFGNMMNGKLDCAGVTVTILTNSYETTDLFPVNAVASTQFKAMFGVNAEEIRKGNKRAARFRLLEYKKQSQGDQRSLHSKVSLLGDDLIIGSANMDIRSYAMDTNNGVYIQNAQDLAADYRQFVRDLVSGKIKNADGSSKFIVADRTSEMTSAQTKAAFIEEQIQILQYAAGQYKTGRRLIGPEADAETRNRYLGMLRGMMNFVYDVTVSGLDHERIIPANGKEGVAADELERFQKNEQRRFENLIQDLLSTI